VVVDFEVAFMIEKGVVVIGSTTIDTITKKDSAGYFKLGGVTTYSGITYSRHGIVTHVVTNVAPKDSLILKTYSRDTALEEPSEKYSDRFCPCRGVIACSKTKAAEWRRPVEA
jgi:hypothetical protein